MNIRGIEILRKLGLPGPRKEQIFFDPSTVNLDELYTGASRGATILVFDYSEPINQNPLFEKCVRKYKIKKDEWSSDLDRLREDMLRKGVKLKDLIYLTHQTYTLDDISIAGRVAIHSDDPGFGYLVIDAKSSFRKANTDFTPDLIYQCPIVGGRLIKRDEKFLKKEFELPEPLFTQLVRDIQIIPGDPNIDFEVYADTGELFYHDMFLAR